MSRSAAPAGTSTEYDVLVVGGGPAGLTAAIFLGRARLRVLVVDDGQPRNGSSAALHGFPTRDGVPPLELLRLTRNELEPYGVQLRRGRVVSAHPNEGTREPIGFRVALEDGDVFRCRRLLLATGVRDLIPDVEGMLHFYGRGVFHCPYCDGWEVRDRPLVAYGPMDGAAGLGLHLLSWSREVTVCSAGGDTSRARRTRLARAGVRVVEEPVARLEGSGGEEDRLEAVVLTGGERIPAAAVFLSVPTVQRSPLAEQLGCRMDEKGNVRVRGAQRTGVPGLFLAGDAAGDVQFAVVAAGEGARAAVAIHHDLEREGLR